MMKVLNSISNFIESLNKKDFQKYAAIYIGVIVAISGALIYLSHQSISGKKGLKKEIQSINGLREEIKDILTLDKNVKRQKKVVDLTLKKRNFKLQHYFENIINKLHLQRNLQKHAAFVSNLENLRAQGYSEVRVEANLINMNTKKLVELLDEIEKAGVIYTKILEITSGKSQVIDVAITIATLQIDKATG